MEKPYLSNKEYNKLNKQRIKINNKKSIKIMILKYQKNKLKVNINQ